MKLTYKDLTDDLAEVVKAQEKDPLERYSVDIEGNMKTMNATKVLSVIDNAGSFEERESVIFACVAINNGIEWWAIDGFNQDPMALRYLVTVVYTRFLKKYTA